MSFHVPEQYRLSPEQHALFGTTAANGQRGAFRIPHPLHPTILLFVIADEGTRDERGPLPLAEQWEHVSVHVEEASRKRTPTWAEMCLVKELFWDREDTVIQLHPPRSRYVNDHPYVLHLWRQVGVAQPLPPRVYV